MASRKIVPAPAPLHRPNPRLVDIVCQPARGPVIGGVQIDAGVTTGVQRDAWDRWHAQNINSAMVKSGQIFARDPEA